MYLQKLKIGNVELNNNILLAPMAGITDLPFRRIAEKFEPGLVTTEMISAKAIMYDDQKTKKLMDLSGEKRPVAIQIFGSDIESMGYAAKYVSKFADIVDINMGCPAPKVVKNGDGSALLLDLKKAKNVIEAVIKNSTVPVTLKIRSGWDKQNIVATQIAKIAESLGVSAITIHGRTRSEFYSGNADLEIIKAVKDSVSIPVIGNGDIVDEISALRMFEYTGVDGIAIGRGALGNPWIFERIKVFLNNGTVCDEVPLDEKRDIIKEHLDLLIKEKGEYTGIREFRKHIAAYSKGLPNASEFRVEANKIETKLELINALDEYFKSLRGI